MKKKNVYLIGNLLGAYRSQAVLTSLINSGKYNINFSNFSINLEDKGTGYKILRTIDVLTSSFFRLYFLLRADFVFVLAMNNNKIIEILLARMLGKKIISDFYISYFDTRAIDRRLTSKQSLKSKLYRYYDLNLLKSKKVFFLNRSEREYYVAIVKKNRSFEVNSSILPLCIEDREKAKLTFFTAEEPKVINICWWGTFIPLHGLEKIIEAMSFLNKRGISYTFNLFGDSINKAKPFKNLIDKLNLGPYVNVYSDHTFSNGKLGTYLIDNCDLAIGAFGDSAKAKTVITNKVIDALSMQIPVLTGCSSGIEEYFENDVNLFICENQPQIMASKIEEIIKSSSGRINKIVDSGYKIFTEHFSYQAFDAKILKELDTI